MKYIKYLVLSLLVSLVATSCDKQEHEFPWVSTDGKALFQVYYMVPMKSVKDNYIYSMEVNKVKYSDNHSAYLTPMSRKPHNSTTTALYYTTDAGEFDLQLFYETSKIVDDSTIYTPELKYANKEVSLEANKEYQLFVYDMNKAPVVVETGNIPVYNEVDSLGSAEYGSIKLVNLLFDSEGVPTKNKIKLKFRDGNAGEFTGVETPAVAFGEATEWNKVKISKEYFNSSGYEYLYHDVVAVDANGNETVLVENDYWTTYIGRASYWVMRGSLDGTPSKAGISLFWIL